MTVESAYQVQRGIAGGATGNTFIAITTGGVRDFANNPLVEVLPNAGLPSTTVTADTLNPNLIRFDLDIDSGLLTLEFDNVMNVDTLDLVEVLPSAINEIKRLTGLANNTESSFLTIGAELIQVWM